MNPSVESISAVFPCYNDARTIGWVVDQAVVTMARLGVEFEVVVVNDGSVDDSAQVLQALAVKTASLRVVTHPSNRGYGGALRSGFAEATKQWIFYTDGDGQYDPAEIEVLVATAGPDVDVVQGYKANRADNATRARVGRLYHFLVSHLFGLRIRDTNCDFRLIRRGLFQQVRLTHSSGAICVEIVRKLQDAGARFVEVPVSHFPRRYGESEFFRGRHITLTMIDLGRYWIRAVTRRKKPGFEQPLTRVAGSRRK